MTIDPDLELIEAAMERDTRLQMLDGLQQMVDFLRENPQAPMPYGIGGACFLEEDEARKGREGIYGWKKDDAGRYLHYYKTWGPNARVAYSIYVDKSTSSTCKLVKLGTKIVPAVPAHEEDDLKWVCEPIGEDK
jgi:hypothetical protein